MVGAPGVRGSAAGVALFLDDGLLCSLVLLAEPKNGHDTVPKTPDDAASADGEEKGDTGDGANDDTGDGTGAQATGCTALHWFRVIPRLNSSTSRVRRCRGAASNAKWRAELGGDGLHGSVGVCHDNHASGASTGVGHTLPGVLAVLPRVAADRAAGNPPAAGLGNAVGAADTGRSWNDGLPCFGISLGLSPGCRVPGHSTACSRSRCAGCYPVVGDAC